MSRERVIIIGIIFLFTVTIIGLAVHDRRISTDIEYRCNKVPSKQLSIQQIEECKEYLKKNNDTDRDK